MGGMEANKCVLHFRSFYICFSPYLFFWLFLIFDPHLLPLLPLNGWMLLVLYSLITLEINHQPNSSPLFEASRLRA